MSLYALYGSKIEKSINTARQNLTLSTQELSSGQMSHPPAQI